MEQLSNGFTLQLCEDAFPLSTDSIALSAFARLSKGAEVLDLGAGCGTLGLLLCASDSTCRVTGIELNETAHRMALQNAETNGISHRLSSLCADIRNIPEIIRPGSFSVCISNPPYFSSGPQSKKTPTARRGDLCKLSDLFSSAAWALKYGGDFFLVHRPERLAELCALGARHKLEAKRLLLLRHRTDAPVSLILMQFRKGSKSGLTLQEEALFFSDNSPTPYYNRLYHL